MPEFAAWVTGLDRPGIIAAVSGVLFEQGCNLEDCSMTILSRHFAMTLLAEGPDSVSAATLEAALRDAVDPMGLTAAVREVEDDGGTEIDGASYVVAVYGADRPGIVSKVTAMLAEREVNVTDLDTRVIGGPEAPVYAMQLEVTLPPSIAPDALAEDLAALGREVGVDTSIHPLDVDVL